MATNVRLRILIGAVKQAWPFWLMVTVIILSLWLSGRLSHVPATSVRYAGTLLQFCGLALVAHGLSETRRLFGRPSLGAKVVAWFSALKAVIVGPKPTNATLQAMSGNFTVKGRASLVHKAGPGSPLDRRVEILEGNLDRLRDETSERFTEVRQEITATREELGRESAVRQQEQQKASRTLEDLAVGGIHLEMMGFVWLLLGMLFTSVPEEVARLFWR
jgi:hypothetical protein